ncbi:MAG: XdhC/CoxI family protein [Bacillota bacterium]|nr:XdhC/CoxI family protein [Bacillota bacterium]
MSDKVLYHARDFLENGRDFVVARILETEGSTPRKKGAWMIATEDGQFIGTIGGGKIEAITQEHCMEAFKTKEPSKVFHYKLDTEGEDAINMGCGGDANVLVEYIDAKHPEKFVEEYDKPTTAYIYGAGHVALALEPILRFVDFKTVVIDDRAEYANRERFPDAEDVIVLDSFEDSFKDIETDENSYIVIVTRGHMGDYDVLKQAIKKKRAYLGMIGSRKKNETLYQMLRDEYGVTDEEIYNVHAPIGLEIHSETPEEIAISIVGEMINARAGFDDRK